MSEPTVSHPLFGHAHAGCRVLPRLRRRVWRSRARSFGRSSSPTSWLTFWVRILILETARACCMRSPPCLTAAVGCPNRHVRSADAHLLGHSRSDGARHRQQLAGSTPCLSLVPLPTADALLALLLLRMCLRTSRLRRLALRGESSPQHPCLMHRLLSVL